MVKKISGRGSSFSRKRSSVRPGPDLAETAKSYAVDIINDQPAALLLSRRLFEQRVSEPPD
jgi:hypothetical protein